MESSLNESLPSALRRGIDDQVARALDALSALEQVGEAVHEARRAIKRARALLKLASCDPVTQSRPEADRTLRDAGRCVAELRDSDVLVDTAVGIQTGAPDGLMPPPLLVSLRADRDRLLDVAHAEDGPLSQGRERLLAFVGNGPEGDEVDDMELLRVGLVAAYESARNQARKAFDGALVAESLHRLRKRVKDLRYQLEFLESGVDDVQRMAMDLHHVTDLLGGANDLVVLASHVHAGSMIPVESRDLLLHIEEATQSLWAEADPLCGRLLSEEADSFSLWVERNVSVTQG